MVEKFSRFIKIIGNDNFLNIKDKSVLVLGVGGVGGYVVESLVRSGIGRIVIVDFDKIDISNINRQIIALESTIGRKKVDVLEERIKDINPNCEVIKNDNFITTSNVLDLFDYNVDFIVDACDTISVKKEIIRNCLKLNIPFISSMGTGNKLDPSKLEIIDVMKTSNDPIARIIRKFIKDERIKGKVMVLCSRELPIKTGERTPGSCSFVPSSAGLLISSYVIRKFIEK